MNLNYYPILIHPNPKLRQKANTIKNFDEILRQKIEKMFATMYQAKGIGLAGTQIDWHERIAVMDVPETRLEENEDEKDIPHDKLVLINPEIIDHSEELAEFEEGCLSLPGQYAKVLRPAEIRVRYQDEYGEQHDRDASGLLAVCIQHEIDHLNGILFIDHISRLKRERIEAKLAKTIKDYKK